MIEEMNVIGDAVLSGRDNEFIKQVTLDISESKNKQFVVILDINTDDMKLAVDLEELKNDSVNKYVWIGNAAGPMSPQWRTTTNSIVYLSSQALPNLYNILNDECKIKQKIKQIIDEGMTSFSEKIKKRYKFVWDLKKMGIDASFDINEIEEKASASKDVGKKAVEFVGKKIEDYVIKKCNLKKNDEIALYTLKINGELVCQDNDYLNLIYKEKIEEIFGKSNTGICSLCGQTKKVTSDTVRFKYKFYNTDKISFSSYISGDFSKNYKLCEDCYKNLLVSEVYIQNNLNTYIGNIPLYIIPGIIFNTELDKKELDKWTSNTKKVFNLTVSYKELNSLERNITDYINDSGLNNNYFLNLLFYRKNQSEFKILKLIRDVPPSRLKDLIHASYYTSVLTFKLFGETTPWNMDIGRIFYLIPQRKSGNDLKEIEKILEVYDAIYSRSIISKNFLISKFVELAGIYRFKKYIQYNIPAPKMDDDIQFIRSIIQTNLFMYYLRKIDCLKDGEKMDTNNLDFDEQYKTYINEVGYDEQETALFLLGCLVSRVANCQYKVDLTNKPILEKLTYEGMNYDKIVRLTNEVFEKLKQYDKRFNILYYSMDILAIMKKLLDKNKKDWKLSDKENLYYIISGYSYDSYMTLKSGKNKNEEDKNDE